MAACLVAAGCTGSSERNDADAGAQTADGGAAKTTSSARSACDLLTAEEVEAVHGQPIVARPGDAGRPSHSTCRYVSPADEKFDLVALTVHWSGGKEEWDRQQAGRGIGVAMMRKEGMEVDSMTAPDPLAGIGDAAYYNTLLPSLVLEGDILLEFRFNLRNARESFPVLAKKAVSRL
ncbi:MAG TPA: hypothetical protein VFZ21_26115 [Gemmatimonadaceae bacterium]|nr:hypothetical protein [Gemmatimonadaceae bacterium]